MKALWWSRTTLVWALLVGATLLSWSLGHGLGVGNPRAAGAAIIVVTFIKVRFVMLDFMELRHAPRWMRVAAQVWIAIVATLLVALFVGAPR